MAAPQASGIRAVFDRANALEREGRSIVHLEIGRPYQDSPEPAKRAARAALDAGAVHYTESNGLAPLREAIAASVKDRSGARCDPETVVVTAGGSEAILAALIACIETDDDVLVLEPAWPHYAAQIRLAGGTAIAVPCEASSGFMPDVERLARAITPRTRALILSSPVNPTGAVFSRSVLSAIAELARRFDLIVISDEIYGRFVYEAAAHVSILSLEGMADRTILVDSFSKTYSMTGWRVGYAVAPPALVPSITAAHQYIAVCAPSFAQHGALAALREGESFVSEMLAGYTARREELIAGLSQVTQLELVPPQGAFYAFPRLVSDTDAADVALKLLEERGVALVPGRAFGHDFARHLRLSYAVPEATLAEGLDRIRGFFEAMPA